MEILPAHSQICNLQWWLCMYVCVCVCERVIKVMGDEVLIVSKQLISDPARTQDPIRSRIHTHTQGAFFVNHPKKNNKYTNTLKEPTKFETEGYRIIFRF
jgi:hypothetical protein